jgi:hypothetical protein
MDWALSGHAGWALLAIGIALLLSSVELLTRYKSRSFREIFFSRHYAAFAALNAAACLVVYLAVPQLGQLGVGIPQNVANTGVLRAIIAGLGYLVIARMSILDITGRDGKTYGLGFDAIYSNIAEYLLDQHRKEMRQALQNDFQRAFQPQSTKERQAFRQAAGSVLAGLTDAEEIQSFQGRMDLAQANYPDQDVDYCFTLYQLIRDYTTGPKEATDRIAASRA